MNSISYSQITFTEWRFHEGGSAAIHRAILGKNNQVAVKLQVRHPEDIIREVKILNMVNHHNIVNFYGITRYAWIFHSFIAISPKLSIEKLTYILNYRDSKQNSYIVMPLVKCNLHDYVRCGEYNTKPWRFKLEIALGIAKGLGHLHQHRIIHCDLHSGHVLIDQVSMSPVVFYFVLCIISWMSVNH